MRTTFLKLSARWALMEGRTADAAAQIARALQENARKALEQVRGRDNNFHSMATQMAWDSWGYFIDQKQYPLRTIGRRYDHDVRYQGTQTRARKLRSEVEPLSGFSR